MTMTSRLNLLVIAVCGCLAAHAQVHIDRPVILTGTTSDDRQVLGLPESSVAGDLVTTSTLQKGSGRSVTVAPGALWAVDLDGDAPPSPGTHVVVNAPAPTAGPVLISFNGNGPFALENNAAEPVTGPSIPEGTALSLVFDGEAFQVLNGAVRTRRPCPEGAYGVNDELCVERIEHPASDFFEAVLTCGDIGMRLCTWGEFIVFCQASVPGEIEAASNNWEWTGDASNENGCARVVGLNSCLSAGNGLVTNSIDRAFHCCYSR